MSGKMSTKEILLNAGSLAGAVVILIDGSWFSCLIFACITLGFVINNSLGNSEEVPVGPNGDAAKPHLEVQSECVGKVGAKPLVQKVAFCESNDDEPAVAAPVSKESSPDDNFDEPLPASEELASSHSSDSDAGEESEPLEAKKDGESVLSKVQSLLSKSGSKSSVSSAESDDERASESPNLGPANNVPEFVLDAAPAPNSTSFNTNGGSSEAEEKPSAGNECVDTSERISACSAGAENDAKDSASSTPDGEVDLEAVGDQANGRNFTSQAAREEIPKDSDGQIGSAASNAETTTY